MLDAPDIGVASLRSVDGERPSWARWLPANISTPSHHEAIDPEGSLLLTCTPTIRRQARRGEHLLGGPLGEGWILSRRSFERFHLIDPDQTERAQLRGRSLRPSAGMRRSLELRHDTEVLLTIIEHAPRSTITTVRRELKGEVVAEWRHEDKAHVEVWESRARIQWDRQLDVDERQAVVLGLVAWRLTHPAYF